jgi:hypothetical protein
LRAFESCQRFGVKEEPRDNIGDSVERERKREREREREEKKKNKKKKWMFCGDREEIHTKSSGKGKG